MQNPTDAVPASTGEQTDSFAELPGRRGVPATLRFEDVGLDLGGRRVVDGVSVSALSGLLVIAGPNGAGKTTFLKLAATLLRPTRGTVRVCGYDTARSRDVHAARRRIGYLPQEMSFPGGFTGAEAVLYSAWLERVPVGDRETAVASALRSFGADHLADRKLKAMSTGERQRVFLAQATVHRPQLLLLDEPTAAVDPEHRLLIRTLLRSWSTTALVVIATHLVEEVELLGDQCLVLVDGAIKFYGSPAELVSLGQRQSHSSADHPIEAALRYFRIAR